MAHAVIVGASGAFGRLFSSMLGRDGFQLTGIDTVAGDAAGERLVRCDATALSADARAALATADVVVVSLPEVAAVAAAEGLLAAMRDDALWVDLVAVKGRIVPVLERASRPCERMSIHPIFAPQSGFAGQSVLRIDVDARERAEAFSELLVAWGARVTPIDASTHDRHLASVQATTHAALLAFAAALDELDYDVERGVALGTKPHRVLLTVLARVLSFQPDAYWEVQESNPHAVEARAALRRGLEAIDRQVESGDIDEFRRSFARYAERIAPRRESLAADCPRLFDVLGREHAPESLEDFRREIDQLDSALIAMLGRRLDICREVARFKRERGIPMMQHARVDAVKDRAAERGQRHGLDPDFARRLYGAIVDETCRVEDSIIDAPRSERVLGG